MTAPPDADLSRHLSRGQIALGVAIGVLAAIMGILAVSAYIGINQLSEESLLFATIGDALSAQRTFQTALLTLGSLFIILNLALVLSVRRTIRRDFEQAYSLLAQELAERRRVEAALVEAKEAAEAANRAKSDFVSLVSHELKAPMTAIKGYADLLLVTAAGQVGEGQLGFLGNIKTSVEQMVRLVSDLADISRIEAGRLKLDFSRVPVDLLLDEVVSSTQSGFTAKDQTLVLELPEDLPPIYGDHLRLLQVLTNLVNNAHKYTPAGGQIIVRASCLDGENGHGVGDQKLIQITVQDNGIGIHPDEQERVFSKFFRSEDEEARSRPGTGLGLNITRYLVEMHQGKIWFESHYRQGTAFHFTVPAA
ncbi:MAG: HAMP domain-containing histidine kinase [Chloroflexi bacterium]|nr:HAMP domain-containing histidine kinase [Chloroflexota bacterium]MCI0575371.1 HAMP domain-containing histidine kinase [Chloroflexota bacterium]MCI0646381.1 HAMP domain-containing histidine kinase [Chloroflexota bacterium]MCI0728361.1 HAMP domain-containing histidine kinase [Chloroflexota bacterium]